MRGLRHGLTEVPVHEIANQDYCELQVELLHKNRHVVPASRMLENGNFGHAGLEQRDLEYEPMWQSLRRGSPATLRGTFDDVPIVGIPDYLVTGRDGTTLLLEFKVTRRPELFQGRQDQANSYGFLAEVNRLCDPRRLVMGVLTLNTLALTNGQPLTPQTTAKIRGGIVKEAWVKAREVLAKQLDIAQAAGHGWSAHFWPYDPQTARATLSHALAYWKGTREPTDAGTWARKCEACPVNAVELCPSALAPATAFDVVEREGHLMVRRR